jgi:hypothetical protein
VKIARAARDFAALIVLHAERRMAELDAEERAGRKKGRPKKVAGPDTIIPLAHEQKMAESRRAPLRDLPERDVDRYGEAARRLKSRQLLAHGRLLLGKPLGLESLGLRNGVPGGNSVFLPSILGHVRLLHVPRQLPDPSVAEDEQRVRTF